jgi:hypothetical protein
LLKQTQEAITGAVDQGLSRGLLLRAQQRHHSTPRRIEVSAAAGWFIQANASRQPLCVRHHQRRLGNITSIRMPERISLHAQISIEAIVSLGSQVEQIGRQQICDSKGMGRAKSGTKTICLPTGEITSSRGIQPIGTATGIAGMDISTTVTSLFLSTASGGD